MEILNVWAHLFMVFSKEKRGQWALKGLLMACEALAALNSSYRILEEKGKEGQMSQAFDP